MAEVKWIKITTDMFDNRKIKYLRKAPEGNNIVLIWVMLLTMAGRCNAGGMIFLTENIPYTPGMLADELGFDEPVVIMALKMLSSLNMIIFDDQFFSIAGWEEYQSQDKLELIKEQNRTRKANQRERERIVSRDCHVTCHADVTQCHATDIDIEIDKDKELDTELDIENCVAMPQPPQPEPQAKKRSAHPTIEEVTAYVKEKGYTFDAEKFWAYYEAQGWKLSNGNPMKNWEACCVTWEKRQNEPKFQTQTSKPINKQAVRGGFSGESSFDPDDFFNKAVNRGQNQ